jgi:hypothetical protein
MWSKLAEPDWRPLIKLRRRAGPAGATRKLTATWKTRMLLDAQRREARWYSRCAPRACSSDSPLAAAHVVELTTTAPPAESGRATPIQVTDGFPPRVIDVRPFDITRTHCGEAFVERVTESG